LAFVKERFSLGFVYPAQARGEVSLKNRGTGACQPRLCPGRLRWEDASP